MDKGCFETCRKSLQLQPEQHGVFHVLCFQMVIVQRVRSQSGFDPTMEFWACTAPLSAFKVQKTLDLSFLLPSLSHVLLCGGLWLSLACSWPFTQKKITKNPAV